MKVYGHPMSTCTRKVLTTLAEKGHTAEFVLVDIMKGEHKKPEALTRQPFGVIPAIDDDGFVLYESRAIMHYLDDKLPGIRLTPSDLHERARMEQWISIEYSYLTPHALTLIRQLMLGKMMGREPDVAAVNTAKVEIARPLDTADKALANQEYLAGKTFSLADIAWIPYVQYLLGTGTGDLVTSRPHFHAWWKRVSARPAWAKVAG